MPNDLKNRRLFHLRPGTEVWHDVARRVPGKKDHPHPFARTVGIEPTLNADTIIPETRDR